MNAAFSFNRSIRIGSRRDHNDATELRDDPALRLATGDRAGTAPLGRAGRLPSQSPPKEPCPLSHPDCRWLLILIVAAHSSRT